MLAVKKIHTDWNKDEPASAIMKENCYISQMMSKSVLVLYNTMNFTYFLRTVASRIFDTVEERKFLAQVTFPFDARQSPIYDVVVMLQFITASICFNSNVFVEGFLSVLVSSWQVRNNRFGMNVVFGLFYPEICNEVEISYNLILFFTGSSRMFEGSCCTERNKTIFHDL